MFAKSDTLRDISYVKVSRKLASKFDDNAIFQLELIHTMVPFALTLV